MDNKHKYVIDKVYSFGAQAADPRASYMGGADWHVCLEHDKAMEMGEYFYSENPYEVDVDRSFELWDDINQAVTCGILESATEEREEEREEYFDRKADEYGEYVAQCEEQGIEPKSEEDYEYVCYDAYYEDEEEFERIVLADMGGGTLLWDEEFKSDCVRYYLEHCDEEDEE